MSIAQTRCKGCSTAITGSTAVYNLEQHGGLCRQCRGAPIGYDLITRKHEKCEYCGKEAWEH